MVNFSSIKKVHFIGIGGIGMSALAHILINDGIEVSGSDVKENDITDKLIAGGVSVRLGHRDVNVGAADLVVYSAAIREDNPEMIYAKANNIPTISRADILGEIMRQNENSIAVAGTHGKTTTTSIISLILRKANLDPTILVGGHLAEIGGNVYVGKSDYFVTEACEYMDSFLSFAPRYAIILNIDSDHLDYFSDIEHIASSFKKFAQLVPDNGAVIAYDANPFVKSIIKSIDRNIITYGFYETNDYCADNISFKSNGMPAFDIIHKGQRLCSLTLKIPGEHNITNALAAFATTHTMGVDIDIIQKILNTFTGTKRRFDALGETTTGVKIVDDYAHHPAEIDATISAARNIPLNKLWVLFQPHTYTRTHALHDDFVKSLSAADEIVLADIYAARENNISGVTSKSIVEGIKLSPKDGKAIYINSFEKIAEYVYKNAQKGDLVITMGAGDVYEIGEMILELDARANVEL